MKVFDLDGPFQKYGTLVFDLIILNLLWFLCVVLTLGIGTGAATTALFYVVDKSVVREKGYVFANFFKAFKENFLKATIIWVIIAIVYFVVVLNLIIINSSEIPFSVVFQILSYAVFVQLTFVSIYIFQVLARLEMKKVKDYFMTAFRLANRHILTTILCLIILVVNVFLVYLFPIYMVVATSVTVYLLSKAIIHILKKYFDEGALE